MKGVALFETGAVAHGMTLFHERGRKQRAPALLLLFSWLFFCCVFVCVGGVW